MISRYTRPEMGRIWSEENKYAMWLEVELAASEALAVRGEVPAEAAASLRAHARTDAGRIGEIEHQVKHDVIAFTTCVSESMKAAGAAEYSRWFHFGMTSNDVVDTAQALMIRDSSALIRKDLEDVMAVLKERAFEFRNTPQIGRTHGVHAEPYTFGLKLALWFDEARRALARFNAASEDIRCGKISGAVGSFAHLDPEDEERICERLGLKAAPISSQVLPRDLHAAWVSSLALIAALCEKIALEIRHLQRTEVREAEEPFGSSQKGSSAMPHKRNPVTCEQICGLARVVRSNVQAAYEDIALWHERDISHSSVERVILPDSAILTDYLLAKTHWLLKGMRVYPERMMQNLESTRGLVFSGQVLLDLAAAGVLREDAYSIVQAHAMHAWETGGDFRAAIQADEKIAHWLTPEALTESFRVDRQLRNVDKVFRRVFA